MEFLAWMLAVLFVLFVIAGVIATVKTVRAVRGGVQRTTAQVRRTVEETQLKARTAQPGPVGEAARIRLQLRSSIDNTRLALEAASGDDPALSEALGLLDRLHDHARLVDGELRTLMEREPDRARVAARLPEARERADRLRQSADSLRHAAQERARAWDEEGLTALREQIEIESGALKGWREPPRAPVTARGEGVTGGAGAGREAGRDAGAGAGRDAGAGADREAEVDAGRDGGPDLAKQHRTPEEPARLEAAPPPEQTLVDRTLLDPSRREQPEPTWPGVEWHDKEQR